MAVHAAPGPDGAAGVGVKGVTAGINIMDTVVADSGMGAARVVAVRPRPRCQQAQRMAWMDPIRRRVRAREWIQGLCLPRRRITVSGKSRLNTRNFPNATNRFLPRAWIHPRHRFSAKAFPRLFQNRIMAPTTTEMERSEERRVGKECRL